MDNKVIREIENFFGPQSDAAELERQREYNKEIQRQILEDAIREKGIPVWRDLRKIDFVYSLALRFENDPRDIVIYGAGAGAATAVATLRGLLLEPQYICDSDPNKWGKTVEGMPVISPDTLASKHLDAYIVISSEYYMHGIFSQLVAMGFAGERIFSLPTH